MPLVIVPLKVVIGCLHELGGKVRASSEVAAAIGGAEWRGSISARSGRTENVPCDIP
jgi:hypothetical protein